MVLENVELNYRGEDVRPAFWLNNVGKTELIQVNYTGSKNEKKWNIKTQGAFVEIFSLIGELEQLGCFQE